MAQGYALPLFGADGIFGDETEGVVRQFQIDAGAVLLDGSLKCWGENVLGQLGLGDTSNRGDGAGEMGNALPRTLLFSGMW